MYIVLFFFNPTFACGIFGTAPVRDLGGAVDPDIGCETHSVVVGTTEAYCNMCFGIRRRWRGPWPAARQCTIMVNQRKPWIFNKFWWFSLIFIDFHWFASIFIDFHWFWMIFDNICKLLRSSRPARATFRGRPMPKRMSKHALLVPTTTQCIVQPLPESTAPRKPPTGPVAKIPHVLLWKSRIKKNKTIYFFNAH